MRRSQLISIVLAVCSVFLTPSMAFAQMGLDLNGYCVAHGYSGVMLIENTAYGWRCVTSSSETADMNLYDACAWQHGSAYPTPQFSDFNNPNSWACYGNSQPPPPPPAQAPSCNVTSINVSPSNGNSGTVFTISGSGSCNTGVRAIRLKVNGNIFYELGSPSVSATWNSSGSGEGIYTATVEVAGQSDDSWSYAVSGSVQFSIGSQSVPPQAQTNATVSANGSGNGAVGSNSNSADNNSGQQQDGSNLPRVSNSCPAGNSYVQVVAEVLNIRSNAGTNFPRVAQTTRGSCFELVHQQNGWYEIRFNGGTGWVSAEWVQVPNLVEPDSPPTNQHPNIVNHGNGWCSVTPVEVGFYGFHGLNPRHEMLFPPEVNLNDPLPEHFFYYKNSWVGSDVVELNLTKHSHDWDPANNVWRVGISGRWITLRAATNDNWYDESNWRLDYRCN